MQSLKKWVFAIKSYKTRSFNKAVSESEYDKNGNLISQETEVSNDGVTETESREYAYDSNKKKAPVSSLKARRTGNWKWPKSTLICNTAAQRIWRRNNQIQWEDAIAVFTD